MMLDEIVADEPLYLLRTMCGNLQQEMETNGMFAYRSGLLFNRCIIAGSYSFPATKSVSYISNTNCSSYTIQYYNDSVCTPSNLFHLDPPQAFDGVSCVRDSYIFSCTTISSISANDYSGILQYGYEDNTCSEATYFMQYGCPTDAETCINLEPFGAQDSARILCSDNNGTTIHYGGNFNCSGEPVVASTPEDTCEPYTAGIDDMFSQGSVYFTGTQTRKIICSKSYSKNGDSSSNMVLILGCAAAAVVLIGVAAIFLYRWKSQKRKSGPEGQVIESLIINRS